MERVNKETLLLVQFGTHCDLNPYPDIHVLRYSTLMYLTLLRTDRFIVLIKSTLNAREGIRNVVIALI